MLKSVVSFACLAIVHAQTASWNLVDGVTGSSLNSMACNADGSKVFLAGSAGLQVGSKGRANVTIQQTTVTESATLVAVGGQQLFVGNATNVFLSSDNGQTFTPVTLPAVQTTGVVVQQAVSALAVSADDSTIGVAVTEVPEVGSGVYSYLHTSSDSGKTWNLQGNGIGIYNALVLSKDGSNVAATYKASRMNGPGALQTISNGVVNPGVNVSSLNETQWTNVGASRLGNELYACRAVGNATWSTDWGKTWNNSSIACDTIAVVSSTDLWATHDGKLSVTKDGKTWATQPVDATMVCTSEDGLTTYAAGPQGLNYRSITKMSGARTEKFMFTMSIAILLLI